MALVGGTALGATDAGLNPTLTRNNQSVILSWFGSNAATYRVVSGSTLTEWTNAGPVLAGTGGLLFVTNLIAGQSHGFFRIEQLIPAEVIAASFDSGTGVLTVVGDDLSNSIVVSRDAPGDIRVNQGAVPISGGTATVANTALIQIFGRGGNDQLSLDESNGALPRAQLFGEAGDDTLIGGSGADVLNGGPGSDTLMGRGGADSLLGGDDDDVVIGGDGDDVAQMGAGNDRFVWNPGDDTDLVDGGDGIDTVEINGGNDAEDFTTTANGTRVRFDRVNPAPFSLDIGTCENLVLNANGGNDTFAATGNLAALIQLTVDGGAGDDRLLGGNGNDLLLGGDGNDFVDGNQGNDVILLGAGDDVFQWDPGDGSDTIEGQAGNDALVFNASNVGESIDLSANGGRLRFFRNVGSVSLDIAGIEAVQCNTLGGADIITVNDLSGTDVTAVILALSGTLGSTVGDAQVDSVVVNGTGSDDTVVVSGAAAGVSVLGLSASLTITGSEAANDRLIVNLLDGNDTLDASSLAGGFLGLTANGGNGDDVLSGSGGDDVLQGADGNDVLLGGPGIDVLDGGTGDNIVIQ